MSQFLPDGYVLRDTYQIQCRLGQGGFAVTYRALHLQLDEIVCIKESFKSEFQYREKDFSLQLRDARYEKDLAGINANVQREARALSSLRHESVVGVRDVFEENNTSYIVLDFVEGETLKQMVERFKKANTALGPHELRHIFLKLAKGLDFVHANGMLHQDISPDNIMICGDYDPVLIDFGSVSRLELESSTQSRLSFFKDGYSAPELYHRKENPTKASDVYSLAATMLFAITGEKPLDAIARKNVLDPISKMLPLWVAACRWDAPLENAMILDSASRISDLRPMINAFLRPVVEPPPAPPPPSKLKRVLVVAVLSLPFVGLGLGWLWRHGQPDTHERTAEHVMITTPGFTSDLVNGHLSVWPTSGGAEYRIDLAQEDGLYWEGLTHLKLTRFEAEETGGFSYSRSLVVESKGKSKDTIDVQGWLDFGLFSGKVTGWTEQNPVLISNMNQN